MLAPFQIHEPRTIDEACRLLEMHGPDATPYAGGTELLVLMKERLIHYRHLVNLKTIPGLNRIWEDQGQLVIGALATHRDIERSPIVREHVPLLAHVASIVANRRVRAAGTIGGNLCFAEPHSDPATLLIALGATITLTNRRGVRGMRIEHFFTGLMETAREPEELMTEIRIPLPVTTGIAYERFKTHERPTATVAVALDKEKDVAIRARIVAGSVVERPARLERAEAAALATPLSALDVKRVAETARDEVVPTEDAFESAEYKRHLIGVLTSRALASAMTRSSGEPR